MFTETNKTKTKSHWLILFSVIAFFSVAPDALAACSGTVQGKAPDTNTYGLVMAGDGKCWLDRNLGASQVANNKNDPLSYGYRYQWGRLTDGHQVVTSSTINTVSSSYVPGHNKFIISGIGTWLNPMYFDLWQPATNINNPCPNGFRVPTQDEWAAVRIGEGINSADKAYSSVLKLPSAGGRNQGGAQIANPAYSIGLYWSSTIFGPPTVGTIIAFVYYISSSASLTSNSYNFNSGFSVRCIAGTSSPPPVPTASITVSPNPVAYNGRSTLTWSSTNATSCTAYGPWSNLTSPTGDSLNGSGLTDHLTSDTTFEFQCTGAGGTSAMQSVTVTVDVPVPCTSDANVCGQTSTGTIVGGICNAITPSDASCPCSGSTLRNEVPTPDNPVQPKVGSGKYSITRFGSECINNTTVREYFVPLGSSGEFNSFLNSIEAGNLSGLSRISI
ncbi:MAG: hypothetical protein WCS97_01145 [Candidatus Paceibacterota bacterium]|jgi:uncharacterized protein (TIGR02145 family)